MVNPAPLEAHVNCVYYPNWHVYKGRPPSSLRLDIISHVFYAFAHLNADGSIKLSDAWADDQMEVDGQNGCLRAFAALKTQGRNRHLKVLLSIGGGGEASNLFASVASTPETRHNFGRSAFHLVVDYGLDGIDIDWEYPTDVEQGYNYVRLLHTARDWLPPPMMLTSALPAGHWALSYINLRIAQGYLDFINLMAYDFSGPWVDLSGHHAQLFTPTQPHSEAATLSCQAAVDYLKSQGVPGKKIVLGVPAYGRSFLGATAAGQAYTGHGGVDGTFEYCELPRPGSQECVDEMSGAAFCVSEDGGFVSYDTPQTVRMKAEYAMQNDLGGLFYWPGTADQLGSRSLVQTGFMASHPFITRGS